MKVFITAIHTDSGKTLVSAVLCTAFQADYWKPVQAGLPRDSDRIRELTANEIRIHPEKYLLKTPESPHAAAKKDGVVINVDAMELPETQRNLIVEGAGGCLVPLNNTEFVIDIAKKFNLPVIVVSNTYLGSINHTLLTLDALRHRKVTVKGIIFNGKENADTEQIILHHAGIPCLLRIPVLDKIDSLIVKKLANEFNNNWARQQR